MRGRIGNIELEKLLLDKKMRIILSIFIIIIITIISLWYFFAGWTYVSVENIYNPSYPNASGGYLTIDGEKILEIGSPSDGLPDPDWKKFRLFWGWHEMELFYDNGTLIGSYDFFLDYSMYFKVYIYSPHDIYFYQHHRYPQTQNFVGMSENNFKLFVGSLILLNSLPFVYWWKIRKEEGKNNESNSKNKGG